MSNPSKNDENNVNENNNNNNDIKKSSNRPPSPNPFLNYLSTSPSNISPRSDSSASASPRSPRFQTEFFQNGMKIPTSGAAGSSNPLTAGISYLLSFPTFSFISKP